MIDRIRSNTGNPDIIHLVESSLKENPLLLLLGIEDLCTKAHAAIGKACMQTKFKGTREEVLRQASTFFQNACNAAAPAPEMQNVADHQDHVAS